MNIFAALKSKQSDLDKLRKKENPSAKSLSELEWDLEEYQYLSNECRWAVSAASQLDTQTIPQSKEDHQVIESKYKEFRSRVHSLVCGLVRKQRQAASHAMVLMISPEARARKPYAIPVQLLPYRGMKDSMMRNLANKLKAEMTSRGMEVVGMSISRAMACYFDLVMLQLLQGLVTDGEFNSLRSIGMSGPTNVLQILADCRSRVSSFGYKKMLEMLTLKGTVLLIPTFM